ncbi:MAG: hypothetical protein ACD_67C00163G0001, partial [uncultured bacterium]
MQPKKWSLQIGGRELVIETGLLAKQANGAVTVRYGDTVVLATAVMSKSASRIGGYFPLMVDYEERYYAAGKIKGSRFIKREGRPSDEAVLTGRVVDRTIRPLFNPRMRNDVQVVVTVLSIDGENDPAIVSMIAASTALSISNIPWNGPIGAVRVGRLNGELILNPVNGEVSEGDIDLIIAGTKDKVNMVEAGMKEVPEEDVVKAFSFGHEAIKKITALIDEVVAEVGVEKSAPALLAATEEFEVEIKELYLAENLSEILYHKDKMVIEEKMKAIKEKINAFIKEKYSSDFDKLREVAEQVFEEVADEIVHQNILEKEQRPDGRKLSEVRSISCITSLLPRTHGSAVFTRGETQALTVTTLGSPGDEQFIDTMEVDIKKRYIH